MKKYFLTVVILSCFSGINSMEKYNPQALLDAAYRLDADEVERLVEARKHNLELRDPQGRTALFLAVKPKAYDGSRYVLTDEQERQVQIITLFVGKGARTDVRDDRGRTMHSYAQEANWEHALRALQPHDGE